MYTKFWIIIFVSLHGFPSIATQKETENKQYPDGSRFTSFPFESRLENINSSLRLLIFVSNKYFYIIILNIFATI